MIVARRVLVIAAGLIAAAGPGLATWFVTSAAAQVGGVAAASGSASFTDPVGDANGAPDITTITVNGDSETGAVELSLTAMGIMTADPASIPDVVVYLNTDQNATTGMPITGSDYRLFFYRSSRGDGWDFKQWNGGTASWADVQHGPIQFTISGDTLTWQLNTADFGGTSGFSFWAVSAISNPTGRVTSYDDAPDASSGQWEYTYDFPVAVTVVKPVIGAPVTTPRRAVAGKRFTVSFPVTRNDNGAPLTRGTMILEPSVAGRAISHAESFKNGTAQLSVTIPQTAKGKLLRVKVMVKLDSKTTTRIATFHVS